MRRRRGLWVGNAVQSASPNHGNVAGWILLQLKNAWRALRCRAFLFKPLNESFCNLQNPSRVTLCDLYLKAMYRIAPKAVALRQSVVVGVRDHPLVIQSSQH